VLVVDQAACWARHTAESLRSLGFDVRTSSDGATAFSAVLSWVPDVVLLDVCTPEMDAPELSRRLRAFGYTGGILVYSAHDSPVEVVLAHEAGADDYLSKATDLCVVQAKIRRAVARQRSCRDCAMPKPNPGHFGDPGGRNPTHANTLPVDRRTLTRLEEHLLCELVRASGAVAPIESLLAAGWGTRRVAPGLLYDCISNLRGKLEPAGWKILNIRGRGYRLQPHASERRWES
jgi:DNA-binding response OmpR family regulator